MAIQAVVELCALGFFSLYSSAQERQSLQLHDHSLALYMGLVAKAHLVPLTAFIFPPTKWWLLWLREAEQSSLLALGKGGTTFRSLQVQEKPEGNSGYDTSTEEKSIVYIS